MPTPPPPLSATGEEELELMPKSTDEEHRSFSSFSSIKAEEKTMPHDESQYLTFIPCKHRRGRACPVLWNRAWTLLILALLAVTSVRTEEVPSVRTEEEMPSGRTEEPEGYQKPNVAFSNTTANGVRREGSGTEEASSVRTEELEEDQKLQVAFSNTTANGVRREGIDTALRKYAFMALSHARTGIIYNVSLPPFLDGIICQAMRVRSGSARRRGLTFNEFTLPQGLVVVTGGPFVIMVYRKIVNFTVYSLPEGYAFVGPVVGIVIYTNTNTTFDDEPLPEMNVVLPNASITARPPISQALPAGSTPLCAFFDINGTVSFDNVSSVPNNCSSASLMDVGLVLPASLLPPPPSYSPSPAALGTGPPASSQRSGSNVWKIALLAVIGGLVGLVLMTAVVVLGFRVKDECNAARVEEPTDDDETLQTSLIGHTRAPTAAGVRTKPSLETGSLHT